ncbi:diacylglycerol kinase [Chromobacterium violaceum]|uniref:Diacylglycerol kinase n=2 Tax=Chromobacterium violaceum TaxID=536 RepID=A0A1R0MEN2_CHRVL|nr:diacylglycerol kinase [Chromobacterium violaceum]AAQ61934.1 diacylglycerol kinase [Chromobacterium violaceum ATCC 12472]ATP30450.1 diacylglycerol kinase [Chromobacterium violaceum]ATP34358.1 diacylglycerol kinase [Chromobacterium violaceum]KMN51455.1 diacylglycerol kinase [Chromobacterium violaceum]KMN86885.1 diacylglycerol kinase [Chromobacterium violaceum]
MGKQQESPFKGKTGVTRLVNAFGYSIDGLKAALRHEDAFRQLSILALLLIPAAFLIHTTPLARALLVASSLATLIIELLNSAIEAAVDHTSLERHPLAKRAKDMGSAAQLLGLINLATVWGIVLFG